MTRSAAYRPARPAPNSTSRAAVRRRWPTSAKSFNGSTTGTYPTEKNMSFQQGLSGLNAASKSLEVIGNNVANSSTVGFKGSQAQFADVYAISLSGGGSSQVGIGVKVSKVSQQFSQGNITASNNPLDIAINGSGFFRMDSNGSVTYARNGQFELDKNGYIVNATGAALTGYTANA